MMDALAATLKRASREAAPARAASPWHFARSPELLGPDDVLAYDPAGAG